MTVAGVAVLGLYILLATMYACATWEKIEARKLAARRDPCSPTSTSSSPSSERLP